MGFLRTIGITSIECHGQPALTSSSRATSSLLALNGDSFSGVATGVSDIFGHFRLWNVEVCLCWERSGVTERCYGDAELFLVDLKNE